MQTNPVTTYFLLHLRAAQKKLTQNLFDF